MIRNVIQYKLLHFYLNFRGRFEVARYEQQKALLSAPAEISTGSNHLFLTYGRGGGADKHVEEAAAAIETKGAQARILSFNGITRTFTLSRATVHSPDALRFKFPSQYHQMVTYLKTLNLGKLHIHHIRFLPFYFISDLLDFTRILGVPYDYMMHDFVAFCPRVHLIDRNFSYCGMPEDVTECNRCIAQNGALVGSPKDVDKWRKAGRMLLTHASERFAPSNDTAERHKKILGDMSIRVIPHDEPATTHKLWPEKPAKEPYVVAVIGRIHLHKGARVLMDCARDASLRNLPLKFAVIGDSAYDLELEDLGAHVTGTFEEKELPDLLTASGASLVFLPSIWPETYSYVLSNIWQNSYLPVAFDLGAPAERIKAQNNGVVLPVDMINSPHLINDRLLEIAREQHEPGYPT